MTRGHRGSLLLRCRALSSPSPCRFIPAHPRFPLPPSQRSEPHTPGGSSGLRFQALHPFHGLRRDNRGSAPPVPARRRRPNDAAGFASRYGPLELLPPRGFRRWASTRPVSRPSRQPATGPPGSYPDGTHTRRRQRAYVGSGQLNQPPPTSWRTLGWTRTGSGEPRLPRRRSCGLQTRSELWTGTIGARRAWTVSMISVLSMPWR